jgi:hypothetical protein
MVGGMETSTEGATSKALQSRFLKLTMREYAEGLLPFYGIQVILTRMTRMRSYSVSISSSIILLKMPLELFGAVVVVMDLALEIIKEIRTLHNIKVAKQYNQIQTKKST